MIENERCLILLMVATRGLFDNEGLDLLESLEIIPTSTRLTMP